MNKLSTDISGLLNSENYQAYFNVEKSKINITTYFKNLTIEINVLYDFNIHVKFCVDKILFII